MWSVWWNPLLDLDNESHTIRSSTLQQYWWKVDMAVEGNWCTGIAGKRIQHCNTTEDSALWVAIGRLVDPPQTTLFDFISFLSLVLIFCRVILRWDDQTPSLSCPSIDHFDNVDKFLFVRQGPIDFVVVSGSEINHNVFVSIKEHCRATVVLVGQSKEMRKESRKRQKIDCRCAPL